MFPPASEYMRIISAGGFLNTERKKGEMGLPIAPAFRAAIYFKRLTRAGVPFTYLFGTLFNKLFSVTGFVPGVRKRAWGVLIAYEVRSRCVLL